MVSRFAVWFWSTAGMALFTATIAKHTTWGDVATGSYFGAMMLFIHWIRSTQQPLGKSE